MLKIIENNSHPHYWIPLEPIYSVATMSDNLGYQITKVS